jgi:hypothetical protein
VVGDPKSLHDLYRVEAQVRATCRSCRATEIWDLGDLIEEVKRNGGNPDWHSAKYRVRCPHRCPSPMITLVPIPFGKRRSQRRAHRGVLLNLSLEVLRDATARSTEVSVGTIEVRLALHVLRLFLADNQPLTEFWQRANVEPRHPWTSCHVPYRQIVQQLLEQGLVIDQANLP